MSDNTYVDPNKVTELAKAAIVCANCNEVTTSIADATGACSRCGLIWVQSDTPGFYKVDVEQSLEGQIEYCAISCGCCGYVLSEEETLCANCGKGGTLFTIGKIPDYR